MNLQISEINLEVKQDLLELQKLGIKIPSKLLKSIDTIDLEEYDNMKTSEISDLLILTHS